MPKLLFNLVTLKVNGSVVQKGLMDDLMDIEVHTSLYLPSMFIVRFNDDKLKWMDQDVLPVGAPVEISFATSDGAESKVITGEITAVEPEFTDEFTVVLVIRGYDKTHRMNRETKTKVYIQSTD